MAKQNISDELEKFKEYLRSESSEKSRQHNLYPLFHNAACLLVQKIRELYSHWNLNYCKGQTLENVGLHNEPYFKYFDYPDFLTPHSGLIQIRKYAELHGLKDMLDLFTEVAKLTRAVKAEIYRLLVVEFRYFE